MCIVSIIIIMIKTCFICVCACMCVSLCLYLSVSVCIISYNGLSHPIITFWSCFQFVFKKTKLHNLDTPQALQKFKCMNIIRYLIIIGKGSSLFASLVYWVLATEMRGFISDTWISSVMCGMSYDTKLNGRIQLIKDLIMKEEIWRFSDDQPFMKYIKCQHVYTLVNLTINKDILLYEDQQKWYYVVSRSQPLP